MAKLLSRLATWCLPSHKGTPFPDEPIQIIVGPDGIPDYASAYLAHRVRVAEGLLHTLRQGHGQALGISGVWHQRPNFPIAACFNVHSCQARFAGCRGWGKDAGQPFYQIVVQANGNVSLCCHDLRAQHVLGNAFRDGLAGVCNSPAYRRLVADLYLGEFSNPDFICRSCGLAQWEERHG